MRRGRRPKVDAHRCANATCGAAGGQQRAVHNVNNSQLTALLSVVIDPKQPFWRTRLPILNVKVCWNAQKRAILGAVRFTLTKTRVFWRFFRPFSGLFQAFFRLFRLSGLF